MPQITLNVSDFHLIGAADIAHGYYVNGYPGAEKVIWEIIGKEPQGE